MIPFSVLDLAPIPEGADAAQAFRNTVDLAQHAERLGYRRYWLAEHHNMPGIASAATAVVIGHVAGATQTIRVGSGGIMLPNHAPLVIAEQFGTLASLYPGRIDLGLGRAPGTDQTTSRALRRDLIGSADSFRTTSPSCSATSRRRCPAACGRCPARGSTCRSGCSARACSARSSPRCSACRSHSHRTLRRTI
jgi:luciferase family oxidoreductase group 1